MTGPVGDAAALTDLLVAHGARDNYDDEGEYTGYICKCRAADSGPYDTDHAAHVASLITKRVTTARAQAWEVGAEWAGAIPLDGSCGSPGQNPYRSTENTST